MTGADDNLFSGVTAECARLRGDVSEMLEARAELVQIELAEAAGLSARSAIWLLVALVLLVSAVPVATVTLALAGAAYFEQSPLVWLAASGLALFVAALAIAWFTVRRFRREFNACRDSLAELHEDLVWVREWLGHDDADERAAPSADSASA